MVKYRGINHNVLALLIFGRDGEAGHHRANMDESKYREDDISLS